LGRGARKTFIPGGDADAGEAEVEEGVLYVLEYCKVN
jgi:hypothetical protein